MEQVGVHARSNHAGTSLSYHKQQQYRTVELHYSAEYVDLEDSNRGKKTGWTRSWPQFILFIDADTMQQKLALNITRSQGLETENKQPTTSAPNDSS
jgi:hypothetical protein